MLNDLVPSDQLALRMFGQGSWKRRREVAKVAAAVATLNRKHGRHTVRWGVLKMEGKWQTKAERKSPRYTTTCANL